MPTARSVKYKWGPTQFHVSTQIIGHRDMCRGLVKTETAGADNGLNSNEGGWSAWGYPALLHNVYFYKVSFKILFVAPL